MDRVPDRLTLIGVSALAYILAVALHEHLGHSAACLALGSRPLELGAFYMNCNDRLLAAWAIRLVALAGPLVNILTGLVCFALLARMAAARAAAFYFVWLLGTLGLMGGTGYLLFSGVSGFGDLGAGADGVFRGAHPLWLVRIALAVGGALLYWAAVVWALGRLKIRLTSGDSAQRHVLRLTLWTSYCTGVAVYLLIGLLNPYGLVIFLGSALASSAGGTSGFLWMAQVLRGAPATPGAGLYFGRRWPWIAAGAAVTVAYALALGPTVRP